MIEIDSSLLSTPYPNKYGGDSAFDNGFEI